MTVAYGFRFRQPTQLNLFVDPSNAWSSCSRHLYHYPRFSRYSIDCRTACIARRPSYQTGSLCFG
ncbi:Uncharacterised protein [Vibrio cholerae]|nr:Uncharacterised protein [Vibrio cholerae]